jgi:hypothetical protein
VCVFYTRELPTVPARSRKSLTLLHFEFSVCAREFGTSRRLEFSLGAPFHIHITSPFLQIALVREHARNLRPGN